MGFTSEVFIFYFLPLTLLLYHITLRHSIPGALAFLSFASLIFYSWEMPYYLVLLVGSIVVNWMLAHFIVRTKKKPFHIAAIFLSVISNLGLLGFFKYGEFFYQNFTDFLGIVGTGQSAVEHSFLRDIILPVGISFYTFQTISYLIDLYRGKVLEARSFVEFLCYVSSFPQLVAGPIVRYSELRDQFAKPRVSLNTIELGCFIFIMGLAKKTLIADSLAPLANHIFDGSLAHNALITLAGVTAYTLQLYFDFSGYSEMAVGIGLLLGFQFPQNFNSPYKALNIRDFWRRWHITLSSWFRDYLYIPMGGNRNGEANKKRNLLATMGLVGLWHGAGWTFVIWGVGHGVALVIDEYLSRFCQSTALKALRRAWVIFVVVLLWIPFRAENLSVTGQIIERILFGWSGLDEAVRDLIGLPSEVKLACLILPFSIWGALRLPNVFEMSPKTSLAKSLMLSVLLVISIYTLLARDYVPFLYFQF